MDPILRKSWPARVAAVGFIVVILAGNAWLCFAMLGIPVPNAVSVSFAAGIAVSLAGGAGLAVLAAVNRLRPRGED